MRLDRSTIHITMHSTLLSMVHRGDRGYDKFKTEFVAGPFSDTGDIMILHLGFALRKLPHIKILIHCIMKDSQNKINQTGKKDLCSLSIYCFMINIAQIN